MCKVPGADYYMVSVKAKRMVNSQEMLEFVTCESAVQSWGWGGKSDVAASCDARNAWTACRTPSHAVESPQLVLPSSSSSRANRSESTSTLHAPARRGQAPRTEEGGKCIRHPRVELSHALPKLGCQSSPTDSRHLHLPFNEVARNTQKRGARSHRCRHRGMLRSSCVCCFVLLNRYWGIVMYGPGASS